MSQGELKVGIIDYGMGNLFSVEQACLAVGLNPIVSSDKDVLFSSDAIILPGVGAFEKAMARLTGLNLVDPLHEYIEKGKMVMGICLGMQLLFTESEEFGVHKGLGLFDGRVIKFEYNNEENKVKVPHVSWNEIKFHESKKDLWNSSPLRSLNNDEYMYFVHSYYTVPENDDDILSTTNYEGIEFCSSVSRKNIFACQFHPERSGKIGLSVYENWKKIILQV